MKTFVSFLFMFLPFGGMSPSPLSCQSPEGKPLDWFILLKLPALHSPVQTLAQGSSFAWTHPGAKGWIRDPSLSIVNDFHSPLGPTLRPAFRNDSEVVRLFYNDEVPHFLSEVPHFLSYPPEKGHTKGVLLMDSTSGFWLIHSAPKFPASPTEYLYPHTALRYAQTFLCISINSTLSLKDLSVQLLYDDVNLYFKRPLPKWASGIPPLVDLLAGKRSSFVTAPYRRTLALTSLFGRLPFISFAKGPRFGQDLYADLVAPSLKSSLRVETWAHGSGGVLNSTCSGVPYPILNVDSIHMGDGISFSRMKDHSKWAIGGGYVCIGDINRMKSQRKRGGGTTCLRERGIYGLFSSLVQELEPCPMRL